MLGLLRLENGFVENFWKRERGLERKEKGLKPKRTGKKYTMPILKRSILEKGEKTM